MSVDRQEQEYQQYENYLRAKRAEAVTSLAGMATMLFLASIDLGITPVAESSPVESSPNNTPSSEVIDLSQARRRKLGGFAAAAGEAELGYAQTA